MYEVAKAGGYLLSPLTLFLLLGLASGAMLFAGWRRAALVTAACGYIALWIAAMPATAMALGTRLEAMHPPRAVKQLPQADAIVVLGGALSGAHPPRRPGFVMTSGASRVWHAAMLFHAGKAPWIIVAAGNRPHDAELQPEAQAIAEMLRGMGVPAEKIRVDGNSRNTRENAQHARALAQSVGARTVLLVTSAMHMERALRTFDLEWRGAGMSVTPATTDYRVIGTTEFPGAWFPTASSLSFVTSALKEFAGLSFLAIM